MLSNLRISEGNCGEPLSPGNGSCTAERTKYGGRRRCTCDYGFKFRDDSLNEATCRVTDNVAKWTLKLPSCKGRNENFMPTTLLYIPNLLSFKLRRDFLFRPPRHFLSKCHTSVQRQPSRRHDILQMHQRLQEGDWRLREKMPME